MRRSPLAKRGKSGEVERLGRRGGKKSRQKKTRDVEEFDGEESEWPPLPLQGCPPRGRWECCSSWSSPSPSSPSSSSSPSAQCMNISLQWRGVDSRRRSCPLGNFDDTVCNTLCSCQEVVVHHCHKDKDTVFTMQSCILLP